MKKIGGIGVKATTITTTTTKAVSIPMNKADEWGKNFKKTVAQRGGLGGGRGLASLRHALQHKKSILAPPTSLPSKWTVSEAEENEKKKRWAKFVGFLSKPFNYTGAYAKDQQALDAEGCINLKRITRLQWPLSIDMEHVACIFYCPYEGLEGELSIAHNGINIVDDAALVAQTYINRGYRVVYMQDPTASEFTSWFDFFLEDTEKDIVVYFIGYGQTVLDSTGQAGTCLLLYNQSRKKGTPPPAAVTGATDHTVSEDFLYDNIAGVDYPQKNVTFYLDLYKSAAVFQPTPPGEAEALKKLSSTHSTPPTGTVVIESLVDVDELLKQKATASKGKKTTTDNSSGLARSLANQVIEKGFFSSITSFVSDLFNAFMGGGTTTVTTSVPPTTNPSKPSTPTVPPQQQAPKIQDVNQTLNNSGTPVNTINTLPPPNVTPVEKAGAEQRWKQFTAEMTKPATYTSKYKAQLNELDKLGCINLDRITRSQIPDIEIDNCAALFFNPYENLPHTLDLGPINDGITMANLLISRGYKVVYLCDGTPKEYYTWMDWLLNNVNYQILTYFSGHGTQCRDTTGKEKDGLSELLVFYDESKKKDSQGKKIKAQSGITENTISDDLMHDLIISKQYPETRIINISDCCHSGTMFDFDEPLDPKLEYNKPPMNVICIGAAKDEQTAKQTVLGGKESGVFTHHFSQLLTSKKATTFNELQTYMTSKISKYQDIHITTTHVELLSKPILVDAGK